MTRYFVLTATLGAMVSSVQFGVYSGDGPVDSAESFVCRERTVQ